MSVLKPMWTRRPVGVSLRSHSTSSPPTAAACTTLLQHDEFQPPEPLPILYIGLHSACHSQKGKVWCSISLTAHWNQISARYRSFCLSLGVIPTEWTRWTSQAALDAWRRNTPDPCLCFFVDVAQVNTGFGHQFETKLFLCFVESLAADGSYIWVDKETSNSGFSPTAGLSSIQLAKHYGRQEN